jgi:hypothetical protein
MDFLYILSGPPFTEKFYLRLFKLIRKSHIINLSASFESFFLPSNKFIEAFASSFNNPIIILSPDTGSESLRKKVKTFYYLNRDLIKLLDFSIRKNVKIHLNFSTGFPFETEKDFLKTISLIKYLKKRFPLTLEGEAIELEPCSLMHIYPEKFQISVKRKTFLDFLKASYKRNDLGYSTKNFSEFEIIINNELLQKIYEE